MSKKLKLARFKFYCWNVLTDIGDWAGSFRIRINFNPLRWLDDLCWWLAETFLAVDRETLKKLDEEDALN